MLIDQGMPVDAAEAVVNNVENNILKQLKSRAVKDVVFGLLWTVGGTVVTVVTYAGASGGGRYVVAYGAIIFGAIQFIKGLINLAKYN